MWYSYIGTFAVTSESTERSMLSACVVGVYVSSSNSACMEAAAVKLEPEARFVERKPT